VLFKVLIFLPEGATDWTVTTPFPMKQTVENRITTLDVSGRPVILLERNNVVNEHNSQYLQVSYTFNTTATFRKPLSIAGGLFVVFVALMAMSRFRLSILPVRTSPSIVGLANSFRRVNNYFGQILNPDLSL